MKLFTVDAPPEQPAETQVASPPAADLGAIITSPKARKIAYAIFALVAMGISNTSMAFSSLQAPFPAWLIVSIAVIGNLAVPFGALAIANATTKKN